MENLLSGLSFYAPTRILFGPGKLNSVGEEAAQLGKKAMLVTGKSAALKFGYTDRVVSLLKQNGVDTVIFDEVGPNPTVKTVNLGGELARREGCDLVIGLGGGSAIDAAKYIAILATNAVDCWTIVDPGIDLERQPAPVIAITMTAGTGAEVSQFAVLSNPDLKRKDGTGKPYLYAKLAIVDPELTLSLPAYETAYSGVDALAQAIEPFTSVFSNPVSDMFAEAAIKLVANNLRTAVHNPGNLQARTAMHMANVLAGFSLTLVDTTIAHVMSEAVGAVTDLPHGLCVALSLPAVMEYNCVANLDKFARVAELMGTATSGLSKREAAMKVPQALRDLYQDIGLPQGFGALGVRDIGRIVELASRPGLDASNPRQLSSKTIELLVRASVDASMSYWAIGGR